jgi:CO/xanthine dehydrogenase FAD-binding subunit
MSYLRPGTWRDALHARADHPGAVPIAGGTDLMPLINLAGYRPASLLDLSGVECLCDIQVRGPALRIGAGAALTAVMARCHVDSPALARAAGMVGSTQIRNRATLGGNIGTASPAGDCLPVLVAARAEIEVESARARRTIPAREFFRGVKRTALAADELISAIRLPRAQGPQCFGKVGARAGMVVAVCSFALVLDGAKGRVGTGIGAAGPTPLAAEPAETYLVEELATGNRWSRCVPLPGGLVDRFAELVVDSAHPIDDLRATADYRQHALGVLARRALRRCWADHLRSFP